MGRSRNQHTPERLEEHAESHGRRSRKAIRWALQVPRCHEQHAVVWIEKARDHARLAWRRALQAETLRHSEDTRR